MINWRPLLMMLAATLLWGSSYLFMQTGLRELGPFNLIALRFGLAFIAAAALFPGELRRGGIAACRAALLPGVMLALAFAAVMHGLRQTSAAKAGFLVGLTVILVPLFNAALRRKLPAGRTLAAIAVSFAGTALLTLNRDLTLASGDFWCVLSAAIYAIYILQIDRTVRRVPALAFGTWQFGAAALTGLLGAWLWEMPRLPGSIAAWGAVLALGLLCSAAGFLLQIQAQTRLNPIQVALIFALEPVFALIFAAVFGGQYLTARGLAGAGLILGAVLLSQLPIRQ